MSVVLSLMLWCFVALLKVALGHSHTMFSYRLHCSCDFVLGLGKKPYWGIMCSFSSHGSASSLGLWPETDSGGPQLERGGGGVRKPQVHRQRAGWCSKQTEHQRKEEASQPCWDSVSLFGGCAEG